LHGAATKGNLQIFKYLVDKGADVNAINIYGESLLHTAVRSGNLEIFKCLVNNGADINKINENSETWLLRVEKLEYSNTSQTKERIWKKKV